MKPRELRVVTPVYKAEGRKSPTSRVWMRPETKECVDGLHIAKWSRPPGTLIYRSRNFGVNDGASILKRQRVRQDVLFVDADISGFDQSTVDRLYKHNLPIVGAAYEDRDTGLVSAGYFDRPDHLLEWSETGLVEVNWCGAGFLLVRREVFEKIDYPWFLPYRWDNGDEAEIFGEDQGFCEKATAAGFAIHVDMDCKVHHHLEGTMATEAGAQTKQMKAPIEINPGASLSKLADLATELLNTRGEVDRTFGAMMHAIKSMKEENEKLKAENEKLKGKSNGKPARPRKR